MITVATVLKSGGDFDRRWVWALKRGLARHLADYEFVCLTDDMSVEPYWRIPLVHNWPGWWSKFELFRPGLFTGRVLYLDLDTLVVGDLSDIASYAGRFAMLSDFYQPRMAASGVMAWEAGAGDELYRQFARRGPRGGRSDPFYSKVLGKVDRLQDLYPGQLVSLKKHARGGAPAGARLVCGHGRPRLSDRKAGWAYEAWRAA